MSYQTVTIVFEFESDTEPIIIRKQYQTLHKNISNDVLHTIVQDTVLLMKPL